MMPSVLKFVWCIPVLKGSYYPLLISLDFVFGVYYVLMLDCSKNIIFHAFYILTTTPLSLVWQSVLDSVNVDF